MYASIWLWAASQALLLSNWIAGLAGIAAFAPMYFRRVPREEQMMRGAFGPAYEAYMARTGRILPRFGKS
jgi:protein-S-isoprenylcysteine O-methyltransferase Ste14